MKFLLFLLKYRLCNLFLDVSLEREESVMELETHVDEIISSHRRVHNLPPLPELDPRRSAAFFSVPYSIVHWYNASWYRLKIRADIIWLIKHGYTNFVAIDSNPYGWLARQELLKLCKKGRCLNIYCLECFAETWQPLKKILKKGYLKNDGAVNLGLQKSDICYNFIQSNISARSFESDMVLKRDLLPDWIFKNWE